jgi:Carboxypeptidase regulatory-like domain
MLPSGNRLRRMSILCTLLIAGAALLASGCLWGVVMDKDTFGPIAGANVSYVDSYGHTGTTTTDSHGIYAFDQAAGPIPAAGPVTINVSAPGYNSFSLPAQVHYDHNPNASLANLSSFWDVESFVLTASGPKTDLAVTDLYPDNQPSGTLWARITNNGPDSLLNVSVELSCFATRHKVATCETDSLGPLISEGLNSSDPGQTTTVNSGMGLDTSMYWYDAMCSVQPLKGSYSDPDPTNDWYQETIPAPTGDLELQDVLLGMNDEVGLRVSVSGTAGDLFQFRVLIGGQFNEGTVAKAAPGSQVLWLPYFVTGTQSVSASLSPCSAPETNVGNNQLVKTCSDASHSCW